MSRHWAKNLAAATCVLLVVPFTSRMMPAGPQEPPKSVLSSPAKEKEKPAPPIHNHTTEWLTGRDAIESAIHKVFEAYDLKPHPEPAIPDDPPPHEGAMIDAPEYIIEPPDLVLVEVLEALPGRPISGERLVRHDGTISLGFYGDVHVRGLTTTQAKVKIIKHLRKFLNDDVLGLIAFNPAGPVEGATPARIPAAPARIPEVPRDGDNPFKLDEDKKPEAELKKPRTVPSVHRGNSPTGASKRLRLTARRKEEKKPDEAQKPVKIPLEVGGQITIKIEIEPQKQESAVAAPGEEPETISGKPMPPDECDRIFVVQVSHF